MILRPHTTSVLQNICTHSGMRLASVLLPSAESEVTSASRAPSPILRPFLHRSTWRAEIESPFAVRKRELDKLDKPTLVSSSVLPFPTFGERIVIRNVMTYLEKQSFRWFYPKYTKLALLASCAKVITKTVLPWHGKTQVLPTCPSSNFQPVFRRREVREGVREGERESCDSQNTNY